MKKKNYYDTEDMRLLIEELGNKAGLEYFDEGYEDDFEGGNSNDARMYLEEYIDFFAEGFRDMIMEYLDDEGLDINYRNVLEYLEDYNIAYSNLAKYLDHVSNFTGKRLLDKFVEEVSSYAYKLIDKVLR